jgi:hypothetical protein
MVGLAVPIPYPAAVRRLIRVTVVLLALIAGVAWVHPAWRAAGSTAAFFGGAASQPVRTPWGDPNLQGVWTSGPMIEVPFERPQDFGTRAMLTDEEFARRVVANQQARAADQEEFVKPGSDKGAGGIGPPPHWVERGTASRQASLIVDPPDGRLPALTPDGERRAKAWRETADNPAGPDDLNTYDRCITRGVLGSMFPNFYNSAAQILQTPGYVVIHHEMIHETRIVPLDGRPHVSSSIPFYMGNPLGHWDGATLVVETTNFNGQTGSYARNGNGNPLGPRARLVERLTRTSHQALQYEVRVEDPDTYTRPFTVSFPLAAQPSYRIYEYACHEGNYALPNILSGMRAKERAAVGVR